MSGVDDILGMLPIDQIAQQVGSDPQSVQNASAAILPALLGGLQANAEDGGASSILQALGQHDSSFSGGIDPSQIDTADGAAITSHIFGGNEDQVVQQLGAMPLGAGGGLGSSLIKKLLPILAPIVMSYIANQVLGRMGGGSAGGTGSSGGGGLGDILGQILGGGGGASAPQTSPSLPQSTDAGASAGGPGSLEDMLKDVLGSATGGGQTQAAPQQQSSGGIDAGSIISNVLGGLLGGGRR